MYIARVNDKDGMGEVHRGSKPTVVSNRSRIYERKPIPVKLQRL